MTMISMLTNIIVIMILFLGKSASENIVISHYVLSFHIRKMCWPIKGENTKQTKLKMNALFVYRYRDGFLKQ